MTTKTRIPTLSRLSVEQLEELVMAEQALTQFQQEDVLQRILETAILIIGKKGRGKTLSAVGISYQLREHFGRPIVVIGAKMGLGEGAGGPDAFGPYTYLDERSFKEVLESITITANEEENAANVIAALEEKGINLINAVVVMDEARKLLNSRRPQDKLVQLTGDYIMQSRHYHNTIIILAPAEDEIDKRVVRQIDWKGRCFHNAYTGICHVRLSQGLEVLNMDIDAADDSEHIPYYDMYNSWNILGYRKSSTTIKNI